MIRRNPCGGLFARNALLRRSYCPTLKSAGKKLRLFLRVCPEQESAGGARTNGSEVIETVDPCGMAVVEIDLQGIIPHRVCGFSREFRLEHAKQRRTHRCSRRAR